MRAEQERQVIEGIRLPNKRVKKLTEGLTDLVLPRENIRVDGLDNLRQAKDLKNQGKRLIITPNHSSHADTPVLGMELERNGLTDFVFIMGKKVIDNPITRVLSRAAPTILVWPEVLEAKDEEIMQKKEMNDSAAITIVSAMRGGWDVISFLEGTRAEQGVGLQHPAEGSGTYLGRRNSVILPVGLIGLDEVLPKKGRPHFGKQGGIRFGQPYDSFELRAQFKDLSNEEMKQAMAEHAMLEIAKCLPEEKRGVYRGKV